MINAPEAVAGLLKPIVMQALLAHQRLESGIAYNPLSDEVARDPYAVYRRLRDGDPVHRMRLVDAWALPPLRGRRRRGVCAADTSRTRASGA